MVGQYGLVASGRSSIARSVSGQQDRDAGTVEINGRFVHPKTPRHALAAKIAYASEDRRKEGFIPAFSNGHNIALTPLRLSPPPEATRPKCSSRLKTSIFASRCWPLSRA